MKVSSTQKGDALRDEVYEILKAAAKRNVQREFETTGKNCDVYYEDAHHIQRRNIKYGIECKYYGKPLTRREFQKISFDYSPAYNNKEIDYLIVLTEKPTSPGVLKSFDGLGWVISYSVQELYGTVLMGFQHYLQSMATLCNDEGLNKYYLPSYGKYAKTNKGEMAGSSNGNDTEFLLEEIIKNWILEVNAKPLAFLGGYGMGKTSLCKKLVSELSIKATKGSLTRIPVYLPLGDLYDEQGLQGLICKHFTATNHVERFSYNLFMEMNRRGRFIIFLDGFDEMKHAMSFRAFQRNFRELNLLIQDKAKVILLGRPNAFLSEDEKALVLHGIADVNDPSLRNFDYADFTELEILPFRETQLKQFLCGYGEYLINTKQFLGDSHINEEFLRKRVDEIIETQDIQLILRPVHARMIVRLALSSNRSLGEFGKFKLYEKFMALIIEREGDKKSRQDVNEEDRMGFIETLAWRVWIKNKGHKGFDVSELEFAVGSAANEGVIREMVTGSILEPKGEHLYYFSHRSFQEFLVAGYLLRGQWSANEVEIVSDHFGEGVRDFVEESGRSKEFCERSFSILENFHGLVSTEFFNYIRIKYRPEPSNNLKSGWHACAAVINQGFVVHKSIADDIRYMSRSQVEGSVLCGALMGCLSRQETLGRGIFILLARLYGTVQKLKIIKGTIRPTTTSDDLIKHVLANATSWIRHESTTGDGKQQVTILVRGLANVLAKEHPLFLSLEEMTLFEERPYRLDRTTLKSLVEVMNPENRKFDDEGVGRHKAISDETNQLVNFFASQDVFKSVIVEVQTKEDSKARKMLQLKKS